MRDILVRPHDHHAAVFTVDAAQGEDVVAVLQVGAEHLLIVAQPVTSFPGQKQGWHNLDGERVVRLLENRADIDHRIDVFAGGGVFSHGRVLCLGQKIAQRPDAGVGCGRILGPGKGQDAPAAIRLDDVAEVDRLGVRETNDRRGMKAHPDRQPLGQMLMRRVGGEQRGAVVRRGARGVAPVPDEIALGLRGIEALA